MSKDYAEKERIFIAGLAEDTGRDLIGWMQAIADQKLDNRNDIIDWLRHQGFPFARASWLERIHHNGGRLIYAEDQVAVAQAVAAVAVDVVQPAAAMAAGGGHVLAPSTAPVFPFSGKPPERERKTARAAETSQPPKLVLVASSVDGRIENTKISEIFASAKGLRPLAEVLAGEIRQAVAGVALVAEPPMVMFAAAKPFAALLPSAKDLKLYADFGATVGRIKRADGNKTFTPPFPHLIALNDVRQIDAAFLDAIKAAHARVNG